VLDPQVFETLNYDIVNAGREVLAQVITRMEHNLTAAVAAVDKTVALATARVLLAAYADLDALAACDYGFLLGPWIRDARKWANASDGPAGYYEWQARSQVRKAARLPQTQMSDADLPLSSDLPSAQL